MTRLLLTFFVVVSVGYAKLDPRAVGELLRVGNDKARQGDPKAAIPYYDRILEEEPGTTDAWARRSEAKAALGDFSGARSDMSQAIRLKPDFDWYYEMRARYRYASGDLNGALADLKKGIELADEDQDFAYYELRAQFNAGAGKYQEALNDLDRIIKDDPEARETRLFRAKVYHAMGHPPLALQDLDTVLKQDRYDYDALRMRMTVRLLNRNFQPAIADAESYLKAEPKDAGAAGVVGYALFGLGKWREAVAALDRAIALKPDERSAWMLLARHFAAQRAGSPDKRLFEEAAKWDAEKAAWPKALADFIQGERSEEALEQYVAKTPDERTRGDRMCVVHFYIGLVRQQAGDRSTARLRFQSAVATKRPNLVESALAETELRR